MIDKIVDILRVWFGEPGTADLPSSDRTQLWFGNDLAMKQYFVERFSNEYHAAEQGNLVEWEATPQGCLALIILLDQCPRFLYRGTPQSFIYDEKAQKLCLSGLEHKQDQALTLIERVFFYMPLVHAEDIVLQERSIQLYQNLVVLSMRETTPIYQLFLAYTYAHFRVIKEFGRFPQRNKALGRSSTPAELVFLQHT